MNGVGAKTLGYLRGERDLFEERKRLVELKEKVETSKLPYWLTGANKHRVKRFWRVVSLLQGNSRMTLVEMSKRLNIPVSTLFDTIKQVGRTFQFTIVLKDSERNVLLRGTIPVEFAHEVSVDMNPEKTIPLYLPTE